MAGRQSRLVLFVIGLSITATLILLLMGEDEGPMPMRVVVRDLLAGEPAWEVVKSNPKRSPGVHVITPSVDYKIDGAEMPSLVMPPPAEVRFVVTEEDGSVRLKLRAGIDNKIGRVMKRGREASLRFEVLVNDEPLFDESIEIRRHQADPPWMDVGGRAGVALEPGDVVTLRTSLWRPEGGEFPEPFPLLAGFGGCLLERTKWLPRTESSPELPNVVLIVMDTERADRITNCGYNKPTSPRLDELARRGVSFVHAQSSSSWTWPSTASILTGLPAEEHGVLDSDSCYLANGLTTLAEVLQAHGFSTAAWSANPLIVPGKNFDQGFEDFDSFDHFRKSEEFLYEAIEWIERQGDRRFFLYLHLADTHGPHLPHPVAKERLAAHVPDGLERRLSEFNRSLLEGAGHTDDGVIATDQVISADDQQLLHDLYDACVGTGDMALGAVLDAIERKGLMDRTVVAYTSDHGEEIFDHGLALHGSSLYQETVRVPLVIAGPGVPAGKRVMTPVSNRHLGPTLARIGDGRLPGAEPLLDLTAVIGNDAVEARSVVFSTDHGWWNGKFRLKIHGLREGDWVLHWAPEGRPWGASKESAPEALEVQLFNLALDPGETRDVAAEEPERAAAMLERLRTSIDDQRSRRTAPALGAGAGTLEMLRDVGYMDDANDPLEDDG